MSSPSRLPHPPPSASYTRDTYKRREEHKARTGNDHEESYILTLHTNREHHMLLTSLRDKYFPPDLNKLAAHIALFRALPGSQLPRLEHDIASLTQSRAPFSILANKPFRMRQGVGIHVKDDTGGLKSVYEELKVQWTSFLSQQDRSFAPHYTVQNKVADDAIVDQTLRELTDQFHGSHGQALGLSLYRYERGYWKKVKDFMFEKESSA
ncbi:hypothetical protein LTR10_022720 [Elasticomyces elasticus]|uniref:2'-5' RNA ligase family protein n=1 Tax=Exophiala sideris TaxID=1016849 RepID=A0ABR0IVJ3_9EURO|nr:hypothetical protein LTR10_022720 [Elasticomyces elasticus]KAK5021492.1 hypothetical protein LTS07_011001 [Exophiala sideris]KAK5024485.1 hypothetical protein LTR13_010846 [Exophiala sideris]KAK5049624.1 hypothetical protein LTR69_011025 [Exophiala sideris]KAK5176581.1 hypothetical protein LTR44_010867 [Eurotiomycetes sp. CCFEE 6388]